MTATTCPYCGVGCGVRVAAGAVTGDPAHPANAGRLCSKGSALGETLERPGRLLQPLVDGRPASWDAALDRVARGFGSAIAEHGPDSVAFYVSGQCLTEDYYVANKLMKGFIGSANIDTNSRLCMASSVAGHRRAFGADVVPGCYEDFDEADLVVLVGSNLAWCHPILFRRLADARARHGTRVVTIDPRRTATAEIADLHLGLAPGSDTALFNGLLAALAERGRLDHAWIAAHTRGFDTALAAARADAPGTARRCGLAAADLDRFYAWFAATDRVVTVYSQGVNQSAAGTDKVNAILNCHLATGRIGRPGCGPFSVTGQPNAMGGREVGGLANQLAAHMALGNAGDHDRVARFWQAPRLATRPGLKAVELFQAVGDGRIKALWIIATNPAASLPDSGAVRRALAACPLVVVSDCVADSDTLAHAHVALPAAAWGEKDGTVTNSERRISRQRAFRTPPGEARPDWWMLTQVAHRLGWAEQFAYRRPADIFREHARLSAFENDGRRAFDLGGLADLTDAGYDTLQPTFWPIRRGAAPKARLFADGGFCTADGRARFVAVTAPPALEGIRLNTGRIRDQWHTMTRTGHVPRLTAHAPAPTLALHPADAAAAGIADGGLVRVSGAGGATLLRAEVTDRVRPGHPFAPMHWSDAFSGAGPIGQVVTARVDPVSGQPDLKAGPVTLAPVAEAWRGFALARGDLDLPGGLLWSRRPVGSGGRLWLYDLAGPAGAPAPADLVARAGGAAITAQDGGRGRYRAAVLADGRPALLVYAEPGGPAADPLRLAALFERDELAPDDHPGLLAGGRAGRAAAQVCACFGIDADRIAAAAEAGADSVAAVGAACRAGTNCGSCMPEIRQILERCRLRAVA